VPLTHRQLTVSIRAAMAAWRWEADDVLLHALPLHHLHGLAVSLLTALSAGAAARVLPRFDAARVAAALEAGDITVLMAVPTMYQKLRELAGGDEDFAPLRDDPRFQELVG
jgi:malonyl-CoA/methylmalonyl-CoA synthetase